MFGNIELGKNIKDLFRLRKNSISKVCTTTSEAGGKIETITLMKLGSSSYFRTMEGFVQLANDVVCEVRMHKTLW